MYGSSQSRDRRSKKQLLTLRRGSTWSIVVLLSLLTSFTTTKIEFDEIVDTTTGSEDAERDLRDSAERSRGKRWQIPRRTSSRNPIGTTSIYFIISFFF